MNNRNGIAVAGSMLCDHIKTISRLPERGELAKITHIESATGGCVCNTAIDLRTLDPGLRVEAYGCVGQDADGDMIQSGLESHGIGTGGIIRRGTTSYTDVFTESGTGCRTFFQYGGACDLLDYKDIDLSGSGFRIFHIGYLLLLNRLDSPDAEHGTVMARLLRDVQNAGILTSVDVVSENSDRYAVVVPPALKYTDYLTLNEIEAGKTAGIALRDGNGALLCDRIPEVLSVLMEMGVKRRVIIHCPEGAFGIDGNGDISSLPSKKAPENWIINTVGAGDAFCAGALLACYRDLSLKDALLYGNAAAYASLHSNSATGSCRKLEETLKLFSA